MKRILIPVDETQGSINTLSVLQNQVQAPEEVILLYVQKPGGKSPIYNMIGDAEMSTLEESIQGTEYKEELDKQAEKILNHYTRELERNGLVSIKTIVRFGNPVDVILKVSEEENVDLMILGCNGKSKMEKMFLGCVTREVEKKAPAPILIAKTKVCDDPCEEKLNLTGVKPSYAS